METLRDIGKVLLWVLVGGFLFGTYLIAFSRTGPLAQFGMIIPVVWAVVTLLFMGSGEYTAKEYWTVYFGGGAVMIAIVATLLGGIALAGWAFR